MAKRRDWIIGGVIVASLFFFVVMVLLMLFGLSRRGRMEITGPGDKVALIELKGLIYDSRDIVRQFEKYRKDRSVKAIVFRIDSPGGLVAASQEIYEEVRRVRDSGKFTVASMGGVAASGGYYVACAADTILANPGTTTGSIGVIAEVVNAEKLLKKLGLSFTVIKSGEFKDTGSPYRGITDKEKQYLQGWIDDAFQQFVDAVARERKVARDTLLRYADGRVFTGKQAKEIGLVDALGTYEDAIRIAAKRVHIKGEPQVIKERKRKVTILDLLFQDIDDLAVRFGWWPQLKYELRLF